ncbi:DsbA family oxidoreductase [Brumimicrobium oceani]|nr:DsbA family oxidoreductase [Brumimicrobium oceani]
MNKISIQSAFWFLALFGFSFLSCAQSEENKPQKLEETKQIKATNMENKMKVEIWSDVMCPFCYIGKRNFETALAQFADKEYIDVVWKSFQLDSSIPEVAKESYAEYLVINKGMAKEQVKGMLDNVTASAKQVGLEYNFDKSVMVNSLNAHKLLQFAKAKGLGSEAEEVLFRAFFTDGENIADQATLVALGKEIGLEKSEVQTALSDKKYEDLVKADIQEARQVGVQGVPFFVMDRKYAVSGAQPAQAFTQNLEKAYTEWRKLNPVSKLEITQGQSCTPDGICD